jgi:hypothetical protein
MADDASSVAFAIGRFQQCEIMEIIGARPVR